MLGLGNDAAVVVVVVVAHSVVLLNVRETASLAPTPGKIKLYLDRAKPTNQISIPVLHCPVRTPHSN